MHNLEDRAGKNSPISMESKEDNESLLNLKVHLNIPSGFYNPKDSLLRAYPISTSSRHSFDISDLSSGRRIQTILRAVDWLDVERNPRYLPSGGKTFCNIYAYDLLYLLGAYFPRVWWNEESVEKILSSIWVEPIYGKTIFELNCNSAFFWLKKYGFFFGWSQVESTLKLQDQVNSGTIGCIIGKNKNASRSGHISIVVPETEQFSCAFVKNAFLSPLQTQAGGLNKRLFTGENWWENNNEFEETGFWIWNFSSFG